MFYEYPMHYIYDLLAIAMLLVLANQVFAIKVTKKQWVMFIIWMMICYQINFYVILEYFPRPTKYVTLYLGLYIGYHFIMKLNTIGSLIVITTSSAMNGIFTNINLFWMLACIFPNYGVALEHVHLQYTCYILSIVVLSLLTRVFKFRVLDLQRYL